MVNQDALVKFGLSENESKTYLFLLTQESSKANEIYEGTKIQRTFVYEILRNLIEKGLVSYVVKSGVKYFEASDPDKLKKIIEEKKIFLDKILPELKLIKKLPREKPNVELYEGKEGIKTILESILKINKGQTMYAYANNDLFEKLEYYFPNFVKRRVKLGIKAKIIQEKTKHLIEARKKNKKELKMELKFSEKPFSSSVFIWQNKIAMLTLKEENLMGVVIENKIIADTQMQVFDILWKNSK